MRIKTILCEQCVQYVAVYLLSSNLEAWVKNNNKMYVLEMLCILCISFIFLGLHLGREERGY